MRASLLRVTVALWLLLSPATGRAAPQWVGVAGESDQPESRTRSYRLDLRADDRGIVYVEAAKLREGTVTFRLVSPTGQTLASNGGREFTMGPTSNRGLPAPSTYRIEAVSDSAVGSWQLLAAPIPPPRAFARNLAGAILMTVVALGAVAWWTRRAPPAQWRWLLVGAGLWAAGVILKIAVALALNKPVLVWLSAHLPRTGYVLAGGFYIGLLTGVFEVGLVVLVALRWRRLARDAGTAVAIGVGAGAFEALLLGLAAAGAATIALLDLPQAREVGASLALLAAATPLAWLAGPVERLITIPCHVSSRTAALLGVAQGRWAPFWTGFFVLTLADTIAGMAHVSGRLGMFSLWWLELAVAPFALVSVPLVRRCIRRWPVEPREPLQPTPPPPAETVLA